MTLAGNMMMDRAETRNPALRRFGFLVLLATGVAGCDGGSIEALEGTRRPTESAPVIATSTDGGTDDQKLVDGEAAIAYDPDGCQVWIIDDGVEGYSTPRFNPKTGLPICDGKYPPGTVIGRYETTAAPGPDRVPR